MRLVLVDWHDSYASIGWQDFSEIGGNVLLVRSVGWLLRETHDALVLVPHTTDDRHEDTPPQGNGVMTIPTCAVKRVVELVEKEEAEERSYVTV